jgi:16S rRNA (guanine966-N2)-methyltransferase
VANPVNLRIIAGTHRGRRIQVPEREGLRPTPSRVRETLFNWLQGWLDGARVLDAFAGTGALGLEALSRGAAHLDAIEQDKRLAAALSQTLIDWDLANGHCQRGSGLSAALNGPYDLVFLDPPFRQGLLEPALERIRPVLAADALVAIEHEPDWTLPGGWSVLKSTRAGQEHLKLIEPA